MKCYSIAICARNYAKGVEVERECERGDELKAIRKRRESEREICRVN